MKGLEMIYDLYVTQKVGTHEDTLVHSFSHSGVCDCVVGMCKKC